MLSAKKLSDTNKQLEKVKEKIQELKKEKEDLEGYQFTNYFMNEIRYQPIFINLNNKKTSLSDTRINCFNPKLSSKYVDLYKRVDLIVRINSDFISAPTNFDGNLVGEKICKKYVKF